MPMLADLIRPFFELLGLSPHAGALVVAGVLLASWPLLARQRRVERARKLLKEALRVAGAARTDLEARAFAEVEGYPDGLLSLAQDADRAGRFALRDRAMAALRATGKLGPALRELEQSVEGPMPGSAEEAAVIVLSLRREGMDVLAAEKLARFRARWPGHAELDALDVR